MNNLTETESPAFELIELVFKDGGYKIGKLPEYITNDVSLEPSLTLDFMDCLTAWDHPLESDKTKALFSLLDECFYVVRCGVDRNDKSCLTVKALIERFLDENWARIPSHVHGPLNQTIYDSKLDLNINISPLEESEALSNSVDIHPQLPELLEKLRREKIFKTCFELFELIVSQTQMMSIEIQLGLIAELACSKKPITHEVAVLMLLHPKENIRKHVAKILKGLADRKVFTPVDLRRLITIRNWVPPEERSDIDSLIKDLRRTKLSTAQYSPAKIVKLVGSSMDGAGACCFMLETKKTSQRQAAGFLVKLGVGIREPWVENKAPKSAIDNILKNQEEMNNSVPMKSVSRAYVNKIVRHFIHVTVTNGNVPDPLFLQIAEMLSADNWQAEEINISEEVSRLQEKYQSSRDAQDIKEALNKKPSSMFDDKIDDTWFEAGDIARDIICKGIDAHKQSQNEQSLERITTNLLMDECLNKWQIIFLITCLWMRTIKIDSRAFDLYAVLYSLENGVMPSDVSLLRYVTAKTAASAARVASMLD